MRKKSSVLIYALIIGLFLFSNSCKEDDDKGIPVLATVEVTGITQTTAKSGGNITSDGGLMVIVRGVCWSTSANPTIAGNKTIDGVGAGSYTSELAGLTAGKTYYERAYATNKNGTSYGSTMIFQTLDKMPTFTDPRDGNVYKIITIGDQVWMAENLKYLPSVVDCHTGSGTSPYYYVGDYNGTDVTAAKATVNYNTYGVLYNWPAAIVSCPFGWHLPSDAEWTKLTNYLGGEEVAGGKLKEIGTMYWGTPNEGATNETGFTGLPGGYRGNNGIFGDIGRGGNWWSANESNANSTWYRYMSYGTSNVGRNLYSKESGFSVRCIKD